MVYAVEFSSGSIHRCRMLGSNSTVEIKCLNESKALKFVDDEMHLFFLGHHIEIVVECLAEFFNF